MKKDTKEFTYEVVEHIGNISEKDTYSKEVNLISWNERNPMYDIRGFRVGKDGKKYPLKGISLEKHDLIALRDLLNSLNLEV